MKFKIVTISIPILHLQMLCLGKIYLLKNLRAKSFIKIPGRFALSHANAISYHQDYLIIERKTHL
jgi:hypothetical protein